VLAPGAGALVAVFVMVLFSEDRRGTPLILVWCPSVGITPEAPTDDYLYEAGLLVVIPGWSAGPGPEAMNTGFAPFL
jgi:hypothetical protein